VVAGGDLKKSHILEYNNMTYYYAGSELHVPGEHNLAGDDKNPKVADAEVQLLFKKVDPAASAPKNIAIAVGFKEKSASTDDDTADARVTFLTQMHEALYLVTNTGKDVSANVKDLGVDIVEMMKHYGGKTIVKYDGSQTSPDCEDQIMLVADKPAEISTDMHDALKKAMGVTETYKGNNRKFADMKAPYAKATLTKAKITVPPVKPTTAPTSAPTSASTSASYSQTPRTGWIISGLLLAMTTVAAF